MGKTLLYYHRRDLRLHDNKVIQQLVERQGEYTSFVPIYIFPAHQIEVSPFLKQEVTKNPEKRGEVRGRFGAWRCGQFRLKFLCDAIWDLKQSYKSKGADLIITAGRSEKIIPQIVELLQSKDEQVELWYQEEYTTEEIREQNRLRKALPKDIVVKSVEENTLIERDQLKFPIEKLPNFYTEFRKKQEPLDYVRKPYDAPSKLPPPPTIDLSFQNDYLVPEDKAKALHQLLEPVGGDIEVPEHSAHPMQGGETNALKRLDFYLSGGKQAPATTYKQTRNQLLGHAYSTKLSAFLAIGCLSAKLIHHRLLQLEQEYELEGNPSTYWIRFELLWRDYFKFIGLKFGHHLFTKEGLKRKAIEYEWKGADTVEAERWKRGETGVGMVDAAMREMNHTGYMSNRARQIAASFLCKDLDVDWRVGAEYFEMQLIDHDATSNWGNWQYQAGVGNDPRGSRRFNPAKQAHDYDPKGEFIKLWVPELREVKDKMGWTYMWTINERVRDKLNLSDHPGCVDPIKGLCAEQEKPHNPKFHGHNNGGHRQNNGHGHGTDDNQQFKRKARRGQGRPRRGEGGRLELDSSAPSINGKAADQQVA
ncbi:hypothetical protein PYCC9005_001855 [Savitreella phatthalungensis]